MQSVLPKVSENTRTCHQPNLGQTAASSRTNGSVIDLSSGWDFTLFLTLIAEVFPLSAIERKEFCNNVIKNISIIY